MRKQMIRRDIKRVKIIALSLVIILSVLGVCYFIFGNNLDKSVVVYNNLNNKFSYSYKINAIENEFVDYSEDKDYTAYITDLIDSINFDFKYKFEDTSIKQSDIKYKYKVTGILYGYYNKNSEEQKIIEKDYEIVPTTEKSLKGRNFNVDESFEVNLKPLNDLINNFKQQLDMTISSRYDIVFDVQIDGVTKETINYAPSVSIEVGSKTTKIIGDNDRSDNMTVDSVEEIRVEGNNLKYIIILGVIILIALIRLIRIIFFTEELAVIKNVYKTEVNEIIRAFQDKIVVVNNIPKFEDRTTINVDNIEQLIKVSEELFKPVLCYENDDETITQFIVVSDETVYKFIIYK